ncbi:Pentatricopeptide repeat [Macleaya cordata]|uniref:Pentatricopeptide repeat n=1 Tax=Macleaya cordata TaxID=56857 RepID=A0A200PRG4_MACCD|nr:Pentatricopeptide repeat [Macleaya cordata]
MAPFSILAKSGSFIKTLNPNSFRTISTFNFLSQEAQIAESSPIPSPSSTPLPPNPSSGSPLYQENWRNPIPNPTLAQSLVPLGFVQQTPSAKIQSLSQNLDVPALMNVFADWMTSQRWNDMKQLFEFWIRCLDKNGKPNKPDVNLYNHYLRANLMSGASAGELLDLVAQMEDYAITPNTASFNMVLKAMYQARETQAAEKLIERMLQTGKESMPDDESYDLVIGMLFLMNQIDAALKYLDLTLKSGYMVSMRVFTECVRSCVNLGRLDTLASIIERCKKMDQNKALCPSWNLCNYISDVALQEDNSKLAFYGLEFLARWIARGETSRPPVFLSVDEGLVVSALGTAGRSYDTTLLDASWAILRRSLRQQRAPSAESYLGKIYAYASMGNLQRAFSTLHEFESAYGRNSSREAEEVLFSPFTSLHPLAVACSKNGFETLDSVYFQLENLSRSDPPYKSVAALNCVILGCANIWDLERAYQTFESISGTFGLTPDIHSYNALMCAFGKLKKTDEASRVFEHLTGLDVKPNATSYEMLVNAHLINRDPKAALSVIDDMIIAGFIPSKKLLKNIRRRCVRELDYESDDQVEALAKKFKIRMGTENRRDMLFNLQYSTGFA